MNRDVDFRTWNIFRRRRDEGLCCAVSAETPVPLFLLSGDWTFGFAFAEGDPSVTGFSSEAAEIGVGLNGFHLFLAFAPSHGAMPSSKRH